jgi:hypothetical protein
MIWSPGLDPGKTFLLEPGRKQQSLLSGPKLIDIGMGNGKSGDNTVQYIPNLEIISAS